MKSEDQSPMVQKAKTEAPRVIPGLSEGKTGAVFSEVWMMCLKMSEESDEMAK
jgi:hypothetical protein